MRSLQKIFRYQGKQVRTIIRDGQPWWVAKDVCEVLELNTSEAIRGRKDRKFEDGLDSEEYRDDIDIVDSMGRNQKGLAVNEPGLYSLIFKSRKPEAKEFKKWITHEVLPQIRQTGSYMPDISSLSPELQALNHMVQLATKLELEQRELQQNLMDTQHQVNTIKHTIVDHSNGDWRKEVNKKLQTIGFKMGKYKKIREESYILLEERARCNLKVRLENHRTRLRAAGASKTTICRANYLDVIGDDDRLKEIYIGIVNQMYIKYAA